MSQMWREPFMKPFVMRPKFTMAKPEAKKKKKQDQIYRTDFKTIQGR